MAEQEPSGKKPPKKKGLSKEFLKDGFFSPSFDNLFFAKKDAARVFPEDESPAESFLEEEAPVSPLAGTFKQLPPEERHQVKAFAAREERIDRKRIALVAGGVLIMVCLTITGIKLLGGGGRQTHVPTQVKQPLIQPPVSIVPHLPPSPLVTKQKPPVPPSVIPIEQKKPPESPPPKKVVGKPTAPPVVVAKPVPKLVPKYTLEIGRYSKKELVKPQKKLIQLGLSPFTISQKKSTEIMYVVADQRFGEGQGAGQKFNEGRARAASMKLDFKGGIKNKIVPQKDGTFAIQAGPFDTLSKVVEIKNKISELGFTTRIDFSSSTKVVYHLRVGKFVTRSDADKTLALLRHNGFSPEVRRLK